MKVPITPLGQCGFRFQFGNRVIYTDPYLSNSVAELEGEDLQRLIPIPITPDAILDADVALITHAHLDHCDLETLIPLSNASKKCRFICPNEVSTLLTDAGIEENRITIATGTWINIDSDLKVFPVPAAHPKVEYDETGYLRFVGYVLEYAGRKFYHAGDGSPDDLVLDQLNRLGPLDIGFIPVNERNYYRDKRGIIGNMSVREAFQFADDIGLKTLVPTHWDMFEPNRVYPEEIELLYKLMNPSFEMQLNPKEL
ncbi:MAG: MBL fold metallo-hydrolase [Candidatus Thiodiazotropha sp.]